MKRKTTRTAAGHGDCQCLSGRGGELKDAQKACESLLEKDPGNADARLGIANICLTQGNCEKAIEAYQAVLDTQPENADAWNGLGQVYFLREEYERANIDLVQEYEREMDWK